MFTAFGPAFSHLLLSILYGPKWSETDAPFLLAVYCVYICTMALNGILEAFVQGVAEAEQLKRYNYWLVAFSVAFLASVFALIPYGIRWFDCCKHCENVMPNFCMPCFLSEALHGQSPSK